VVLVMVSGGQMVGASRRQSSSYIPPTHPPTDPPIHRYHSDRRTLGKARISWKGMESAKRSATSKALSSA
jgi:hypothetical protein